MGSCIKILIILTQRIFFIDNHRIKTKQISNFKFIFYVNVSCVGNKKLYNINKNIRIA